LIYAEIDRNPLKTAVVEDRSNAECYFPFKWQTHHAAASAMWKAAGISGYLVTAL
jgi:hypothetical protein